VGGAAYPTGTVTLTDALTSNTTTVALPGTTRHHLHSAHRPHSRHAQLHRNLLRRFQLHACTPVKPSTRPPGLMSSPSTPAALAATSTSLTGVPSSIAVWHFLHGHGHSHGQQSHRHGGVHRERHGLCDAPVSSGSASATISLPFSTSAYSIYAVYSGDAANDGSTIATQIGHGHSGAHHHRAFSEHHHHHARSSGRAHGNRRVFRRNAHGNGNLHLHHNRQRHAASDHGHADSRIGSPNASVATAGIDLPVGTDNCHSDLRGQRQLRRLGFSAHGLHCHSGNHSSAAHPIRLRCLTP
jgi:hypothetical protein